MSLIRPLTISRLCIKNHGILYTAVRNHWNKDFKPGEFPKTPEQRALAAEKYQLVSEDYKPYPNDGSGLGDYPDLPMESGESKDPFYPWDNPELKRNFNEPLHADVDMIGEDRYDVTARHRVPVWLQYVQFFAWMGGAFVLYYIADKMKWFLAAAEKQYPRNGKHYTFEPKEE
ncbi:hypothetical protein ILUMI_24912 [Ignelater luminosus]|uniref:NADH dehydrogenase [ubiquinone] 1 beta subcomplex subunit 8, mitochondrial n=1 Tax=Ignelater luminosus TaxID=2038154 RepID=A0A8K0C9K2_IGNLU|nr:hypothetical protein ILUMI_24912 [Ignelater luminosus]